MTPPLIPVNKVAQTQLGSPQSETLAELERTPFDGVKHRIGVLALQGAVSEHTDMLSALGADVSLVRTPAQLDGLDGLVMPGGESTAIARLAAPMGLLRAIRAKLDGRDFGVLGTCAGLILLSDDIAEPGALAGFDRVGGLDVLVERNGYGGQLASFEADVECAAENFEVGTDSAATTSHVAFIRAPIIRRVGAGVRVVATHQGNPVAVASGRIVAAAYHPEITGDLALHRYFMRTLGVSSSV